MILVNSSWRRHPCLPRSWGKVARRAGWGAEAVFVSPIFSLPIS